MYESATIVVLSTTGGRYVIDYNDDWRFVHDRPGKWQDSQGRAVPPPPPKHELYRVKEIFFAVEDESMADRMVKAFQHAIELCQQKEPF
jgi:hypothetical protein